MNRLKTADQSLPKTQPETERQYLPEEVQLALSAFDAALNSIVSMTAIRDANGKVVDFRLQTANRAVEQSLFRKPEDIIGTRLLETFPGNVESGLFAVYVRVLETGQSERLIQYYSDKNGLEAWFEVSAAQLSPDGVVVTFMNITAPRRAEHQLAHQAELLHAILDNAQAALSLHTSIRDEHGHICDFRTVLANPQCIAMWGDLAESILAKPFSEVATPTQKIDDFPKYVRVVETGEPDTTEFPIDDQWWIRITTKAGDGVVIANLNVTENRRYQQQLEAANRELKRSNENLQSFAYIASHDLQEPLRKIQSFGDMLNDRYSAKLGPEGGELISRMQAAASRMSLLIRDLLDYSRISSQRNAFRSFALAKLLDDIIEDLWHPIQESKARIELAELPELIGDRLQLRQLFQNLLSNALKFYRTDASGLPIPPLIRVSSRLMTPEELPKELAKDLRLDRAYWTIDVTDNGIGFEQHYAEQIFQVFQRLHTRQQFSGTGIGLAVVKKVVEQHDGAIRAQSRPGEGTTFTVYLPA
ncbi:ATP-binding protein [Spirosoma sp. SC4-14]|uniref:sensor histidine kinase n=1 Tax=Spirosoma sp. SC4-14 TaxID=3128900 RepID=UPI0030D5D876